MVLKARRLSGFGLLILLMAPLARADFDPARAVAHAGKLSSGIGARPNGSAGEVRARDYIAAELSRSGLAVRRQPVMRMGRAWVGSENVMGILAGRTDDVILVSAHHDSRSLTVPGADDNASGVAVLLEAARVLARQPTVSTLWFVTFCAEEEGLLGARRLAETVDPSLVRVAINLDSVGQREILVAPLPGAPPLWAARALRRVIRDESIPGFVQPALDPLVARTLSLPFGADHEPLAARGVPAFTLSDRFRAWTYHTEFDTEERLESASLEAAGRALVALVRRFDEAAPARGPGGDDPGYVIVPVGKRAFFVTTPAIIVLTLLGPVLVLIWWRSVWWRAGRRGRRLTAADAAKATARACLPLCGAVSGALISEWLSETLTGFRFPWTSRQHAHLVQAGIWALSGLLAGVRIAAALPSPDEEEIRTVTAAGGAGLLATVAWIAGRPDIAFYFLLPAAAILGISSLAPRLAGVGAAAGFLPLLTLLPPYRYADAVSLAGLSVPFWVTGPALTIALAPLALGIARSLREPRRSGLWWGGTTAFAVAGAALAVWNAGLPTYDEAHRRLVRVEQAVRLGQDAAPVRVVLSSSEYLRRVRSADPRRPEIDLRRTRHEWTLATPAALALEGEPEVRFEEVEGRPDQGRILRDLRIRMGNWGSADRARIAISAPEPIRVLDDGIWISVRRFERQSRYVTDAPADLFRIEGRQGLALQIEVELERDADMLGLGLAAENTVFRYHASVRWRGERAL